jgi:integral membrane protein
MDESGSFSDKIARTLTAMQFFSDREAWDYFRIAAFGEAFGWTTLISGLAISRYVMHGDRAAIDIAGQIHGTIFLAYLASVIVFCSSLRWTRRQTIIAAMASIPPYGTLVFEKYMAHKRRDEAAKAHRQLIVRGIVLQGNKVLAIQPNDSGFWCLPGGAVKAHESTENALIRTISLQTGVSPVIKRLAYVYQYRYRETERLEFFFQIKNPKDFNKVAINKDSPFQKDIDELEFISLQGAADFEPKFLTKEVLEKTLSDKSRETVFILDDESSQRKY